MQLLAELLKAIAAILWPIFAFVALFRFEPEIRSLISRVRKGKLLGQEIELHESLAQLEVQAQKAVTAAAVIPSVVAPASETAASAEVALATVDKILSQAATSPKTALLLLATELERELRRLLASLGLLPGRAPITFQQGLRALEGWSGLPKYIASSAKLFYDVRNRIVHGYDATDGDIISAIDSGVTLLRTIQAVPHEENFVLHPGVEVFADAQGVRLIEDLKAIILETRSPSGAGVSTRVFPTRQTHYTAGMRVAWEWNMEFIFAESWYRDPTSGSIKHGWNSSAEFVGRNLDEI